MAQMEEGIPTDLLLGLRFWFLGGEALRGMGAQRQTGVGICSQALGKRVGEGLDRRLCTCGC